MHNPDPIVRRVRGIRCTGCGRRYPDLPQWQAHLNDHDNCPHGDPHR